MSEERELLDTTKSTAPVDRSESRAERKVRMAQVLERGSVANRLNVDLPPELYGEWVPRDHADVHRMEILGFKVDDKYGLKQSLHSDGTPITQIGDVVFMVTSRENKELLDEIRQEQFERRHGKVGVEEQTVQGEEKEVIGQAKKIDLPIIKESTARVAKKAEIEAALAVPPAKR